MFVLRAILILSLLALTAGHAAAQYRAYIANYFSNDVSVIDTATLSGIGTIPAGNKAIAVAMTPDRAKAYVANYGANSVTVIDVASGTVRATVPVGGGPVWVAMDPVGGRAWVSNQNAHSVSVIDVGSDTVVATVPVGTSPFGVAVTLDGATAYVTNQQSHDVSVIDTATLTVVDAFPLGTTPIRVEVSPNGDVAYVSVSNSDIVGVIDTATHAVVDTIATGHRPHGLVFAPDGRHCYVAAHADQQIDVIDTTTRAVVDVIPIGVRLQEVAITPDGAQLWINGGVTVVDVGTRNVIGTVAAGNDPVGIAFAADPDFRPPVADAGLDQAARPGDVVTLMGAGSDPDGNLPLSFEWALAARPDGSAATLSDVSSPNPTLTVDVVGDYVASLVVRDADGEASVPDFVVVSTFNTAPVADAGDDRQLGVVGETVFLDGGQSFDDDSDTLSFAWVVRSAPAGATVTLDGADTATPSFVASQLGSYVFDLVVSDAYGGVSAPDSVEVSFLELPPVADAGGNLSVVVGDTVALDGSASSDPNGDALTFWWSMVSRPQGSAAALDDPAAVAPRFVADVPGSYQVSLVVSDGTFDSPPAQVNVEALGDAGDIVRTALMEAVALSNALPPSAFANRHRVDALTNKLNAVLKSVAAHDLRGALAQLASGALLGKVDGCATDGAPDQNDWIVSCDAQAAIYAQLARAIEALE